MAFLPPTCSTVVALPALEPLVQVLLHLAGDDFLIADPVYHDGWAVCKVMQVEHLGVVISPELLHPQPGENVVVFGLGGILAETLRDTTYRVAPFDVDTAREMIEELRAAAIFRGVRGQPPRDVGALAQTLAAVSEFAWLARDRLAELDLNPVLVRPAGAGVAIADALIVLRASTAS